jgi:two-component system cell cycle response regulator DivK
MKTVLLVDDNDELIDLMRLILRDSGHVLHVAKDGSDAVQFCTENSPDLVLMDLNMPGMNGYDATEKLRSDGFTNPIIVLTGSESDEDREKAKNAGCNNYVLKTMEMQDVQSIMDRYLIESG